MDRHTEPHDAARSRAGATDVALRASATVFALSLAFSIGAGRTLAQEPRIFVGEQARLFTNATVIDGRGGPPRPGTDILVWNGRIQSIGARSQMTLPEGTRFIDLEGAFVIPGLIDAHASVRGAEGLGAMIASGVTGVREAAMPLAEFERRGRDIEGEDPLPTAYIGGPVLVGPGGSPGLVLESAEDIPRAVRRLADDGAPFVTAGPSIPPDWIPDLAREARRMDTPLWIHAPGPGWVLAFRAGAKVVSGLGLGDPALLPEARRDEYEALRAADPRVAVGEWLARFDPGGAAVERAVTAALSSDATLVPLLASSGAEPGDDPLWTGARALVRKFHEEDVRLLVGSRAPEHTDPGAGFHREMELLSEAGVPPLDILLMATRNAAAALGVLHERGTLEAEKRADFVVLEGDPSLDIRNARRVAFVVFDGEAWKPLPEGGFERLRFR